MALFKQEELKKYEKDFSQIEILPEHKQMVNIAGDLINKYIDLSPIVIRGFCWMGIKQFQKESKMTVKELAYQPPEVRIKGARRIFDMIGEKIKNLLKNPQDAKKVDEAINKGFQMYLEQFARR